jgi:glycosyltransferase involved in cell wall biosynthesis
MKSVAVIPAYNVSSSIGEVVKRTLPFVNEVIVVDDGSIDETARIAKESGAKVISIKQNKGKAHATRLGLTECEGFDAIITLDGDLQHCPEEIPQLLEQIKGGANLCIGSRFLDGHSNMPMANRFSNRIASRLITLLSGEKLSDPQSGFRALDGKTAKNLELKAERYAIEHVMILEASEKKCKIEEVPISCIYGDEESQIKIFSDTLRVTHDIIRFLLR